MPRPSRQYTIRNVPAHVDAALRRRALSQGKSINQLALEALTAAAGTQPQFDDLDFMIGTMGPAEGRKLEQAIASQRTIDPELWR